MTRPTLIALPHRHAAAIFQEHADERVLDVCLTVTAGMLTGRIPIHFAEAMLYSALAKQTQEGRN